MNQIYVILGGILWRLMGKRIALWFAHGSIPWDLRVATALAHIILTSTPSGFRFAGKSGTLYEAPSALAPLVRSGDPVKGAREVALG